ncbi:unnamed protein product [Arabis nemorensis]|uniref:Endoplasmic reticulum transmembrane protein n=1 Tax=Arabis nemorensis TaxID=586526 RepID=A0A565BCQ9_9BRAS|nr:unnamed protein product [Arabis nemorensis]
MPFLCLVLFDFVVRKSNNILKVSSILKNGVSWRGFKVSAIFALGFYTHDALTPNRKSLVKEAEQALAETKSLLAEAKSLKETTRANLAQVEAMKKLLDNLLQKYMARLAELEIEKVDGR